MVSYHVDVVAFAAAYGSWIKTKHQSAIVVVGRDALPLFQDEEVVYEERQGNLYHIAYAIEGSDEKVVVATTRPCGDN